MDEAHSDSIPPPRLEAEFFKDHVRQTRYVEKAKNRNETMKEEWSNCGELGRGGFGVVYKQIQKATGHYRAVKTIDKRLAFPLDYSREHLVMAKLAKVCALTPEEIAPAYYLYRIVWCSNGRWFSIGHYLLSFWDRSRSPRLCILQWNIFRKAILPSISVHHYPKKPFKIFQGRYWRVSNLCTRRGLLIGM